MYPAELIITAGLMLGITVPLTAVVEASRGPLDMERYVMNENCPNSKVCIVDIQSNRYVGESAQPHEMLRVSKPQSQRES